MTNLSNDSEFAEKMESIRRQAESLQYPLLRDQKVSRESVKSLCHNIWELHQSYRFSSFGKLGKFVIEKYKEQEKEKKEVEEKTLKSIGDKYTKQVEDFINELKTNNKGDLK